VQLNIPRGRTYLLLEFIKGIRLIEIIDKVFGDKAGELLALICYRLCHAGAMNYARVWFEGNIAKFLFRGVNLSSQRISEFLQVIGNEQLQRDFFYALLLFFIKDRKMRKRCLRDIEEWLLFSERGKGY